jgi:hypothetical protein
MAGRVEYKYLAPCDRLDEIRADLLPYVSLDPFTEAGGPGEYSVRSIYYDTPHLACYREKDAGLEVRRKFRIRGYNQCNDKSVVFLEIKKKRGMAIDKHRAPLPLPRLERFLATPDIENDIITTNGGKREREDARRFLYYYYRLSLRPIVLVVYDREAFQGKFDPSLRVTFDKRLRGAHSPTLAELYDEERLSPVMERHFVLELKFFRNALPAWASQIITRYALPRMALSKYTMCVDSGHAGPRVAPPPSTLAAPGLVTV